MRGQARPLVRPQRGSSRRASGADLLERSPPGLVVAVPGDGVGEALLEGHLWLVAEFGADLVVGQRVAAVVAFAVVHVLDVGVPAAAACLEEAFGELAVGE